MSAATAMVGESAAESAAESESYFAVSVGYVSEATVRRYVEHRWDAVA
jgi:REP element-mobilizing transposase RayT